jgi:hypothetical protein
MIWSTVRHRSSAYAVLAEHLGVQPTPRILHELTRRLAVRTETVVRIWRVRPAGLRIELSWPPQSDDGLPDVPDVIELDALPGLISTVLVQDDVRTRGAVTLQSDPDRTLRARERQEVVETANCILLLWRHDDLQASVQQQIRHTIRLDGELAVSDRRLTTVRDLERRRVAVEILTLSTARFAELHRGVRLLDATVSAGQLPEPDETTRLRDLLDELIEDFQVMVRGVYSQVLQDHGLRAALAEVVAQLPRSTQLTGTIRDRLDPELAATLYYLSTAALSVLSAQDWSGRSDPPSAPPEPSASPETPALLEVHLSHVDSQLRVLVTGRSSISVAGLKAALTVDTDRIAGLGGDVQIQADDGVIRLRAWLPDQLQPAARATPPAPTSLLVRVRELTLRLAARSGDSHWSEWLWTLITRLDGPVRLGVPGPAADQTVDRSAWWADLGLRLPDVELVPYPATADPDDPINLPDAVLQPSPTAPEDRADLLLLGAGMLVRGGPWTDLPGVLSTELVARADLLRARSVLAALLERHRTYPGDEPGGQRLWYELEEIHSTAYELAELEALAGVRTGELNVTPAQLARAERLLGSAGTTAPERLGRPPASRPDVLAQAAEEQRVVWHRLSEVPAAGWQHRRVCSTIVRTCERLLADLAAVSPGTAAG